MSNENYHKMSIWLRTTGWEMYEKLRFDHTTKYGLYKPESVRESGTQKPLWDIEIQTDHLDKTKGQLTKIIILGICGSSWSQRGNLK